MSTPSIVASVEPEENGKLVYLAVAPMAAGLASTNMLAFRLRMSNNGSGTARLNKIRVVLPPLPGQPGNPPPLVFNFAREIEIAPGGTETSYLGSDESIALPVVPPAQAQIGLFFDGHDEPVALTRQLTKHKSPTPQASYRFPGNTWDMGFDEYFSQKSRHTGGSQHFAYDIGVQRWDEKAQAFTSIKPGTSGDQNEDKFAWGKPIYAMADGTVIGFANDEADNPSPGERAFIRLGEKEAGAVSALSLARLSDQRLATAVQTDAGKLKVIVWETTADGKQVSRLGESEGEAVNRVAAVELSGTRLATAVRTAAGLLKVIIWDISTDGRTVTRRGEDDAGAVDRFAVAPLSSTRLAAAVRNADGNLKVMVWNVSSDGLTVTQVGSGQAGAVKKVDLVKLSSTRLLTAVQTADDKLKVIVWDVAGNGAVTRRGDAQAGSISDLAVAQLRAQTMTAVRTVEGKLKVAAWEINSDGNVTFKDDAEAGEVSAVTAARAYDDILATGVITKSGTLKIIIWEYKDQKLIRFGENDGGVTDLIDLAALHTNENPLLIASAVRTGAGNLKLIIWRLLGGGGNLFYLLHGDELVLYAHMIKGSLNPALRQLGAPVKQEQFLGKLGNSGSSSGPHLHIHAVQVPPNLTVEQMIEKHQQHELTDGLIYRPLPFHNAQAMRLSDVKAGILADNKFAAANDQGFYWEKMAVWPGLTTPGIPTGRSEMAFHGVKSGDYQKLFDRLTGADYRLTWIDGYEVGNDLRFNVLFRPEDNSGWSAHHNLTGEKYQEVFDEHKRNGRRLVHVNSYRSGNQTLYAAIFRKTDGPFPVAYHGLTQEDHQAKFESLKADGFAPINVSVVSINDQRRYAAFYEKRNVGGFVLKSSLTPEQYQAEFDAHKDDGLRVAYLDVYQHDGGVRFSAIWNREHKGSMHARHHLTGAEYQQEYEATTGNGFLTAIVVGYALSNQPRFAGVWRK